LKGNKLDPATSFCFASPSKKQETTKPKNPQKIKQKTNKNIVAESWVLFFFWFRIVIAEMPSKNCQWVQSSDITIADVPSRNC
jgi:hypothetical protein